jgi:hypothetical protein
MARPYSLDLERVVAAVAAGESCRKVAATYKVSVASVVRWSQRFRASGSAAALTQLSLPELRIVDFGGPQGCKCESDQWGAFANRL